MVAELIRTYVKYSLTDDKFYYCKVDDKDRRYDIEQGEIDRAKIPTDIQEKAKALYGYYPPYVEMT